LKKRYQLVEYRRFSGDAFRSQNTVCVAIPFQIHGNNEDKVVFGGGGEINVEAAKEDDIYDSLNNLVNFIK